MHNVKVIYSQYIQIWETVSGDSHLTSENVTLIEQNIAILSTKVTVTFWSTLKFGSTDS